MTTSVRVGVASSAILLMAYVASAQTSSVSGRVTARNGGPVANAEVALVPPPSAMAAMPGMRPAAADRTVRSGADGAFVFEQVPPGRYVLQVDAPGLARSSQEIIVPNPQAVAVSLDPLEVIGGEPPAVPAAAPQAPSAPGDTQALLDRIRALEQRISELETSTVLSEPETRVRRVEIWVDKDGNQYDHEVPGSKRMVTYERERAYRRQTINEKIEEALADEKDQNVGIGVDATTVLQFAKRTTGDPAQPSGNAYALASADLFFTAKLAQNTIFFADVVALSGSPPDRQIPSLTLLNGYTARLVNQNELNLREAWLRTELFGQRLALTAGRLDLTNYFDHNAVANDETTQFLSDALVNNPVLGLSNNGTGVSAVYDPKIGVNFKFGIQQSNPDADNLSDSLFSLAEVGYVARLPGLGEGNYRVWYRVTNSTQPSSTAFGLSVDQRLTPVLTLFGRYGNGAIPAGAETGTSFSVGHRFYSVGVSFRNGLVFNPLDTWGMGYAETHGEIGRTERLAEGYYNLKLTERLRLSFHLQHVIDSGEDSSRFGYVVPGVRLQASF